MAATLYRCFPSTAPAIVDIGSRIGRIVSSRGDNTREVRAAWKFVLSGALAIPPMGNGELPLLDAVVHQYRDRSMDFADATLVRIAEHESLTDPIRGAQGADEKAITIAG